MKSFPKFSPLTQLNPQYIIDPKGKKTAVVLDIASAKSIHIVFVSHRRDIYKSFSDA